MTLGETGDINEAPVEAGGAEGHEREMAEEAVRPLMVIRPMSIRAAKCRAADEADDLIPGAARGEGVGRAAVAA